MPHVSGIDMLSEVVRIHAGDRPLNLEPAGEQGCSYRFLTPRPGRVRGVTGVSDVAGWTGVLDCAVTVSAGQEIASVRVGADRAGFVIAAGASRADAVALADRAEQAIRFDIE